jgi:carboxypeptidase D
VKLYLAGESFAGQWIPNIASAILDHNRENAHDQWNLSGLLIGNGWISGPDQYLATVPFAYEAGLITSGSDAERVALAQQEKCIKALNEDKENKVDLHVCEAIMQDILRLAQRNGKCVNMYDTRLDDSYPSCGMNWPPDLEYVTPYLRRPDVTRALHINPDKKTGWVECNSQVSAAFTARHSTSSKLLLPNLLAHMPIVLFSGDKDFICNHLGTENIINNMQWNGGSGMELANGMTAPKQDWTFEGEPAGQYQTARNLTYLKFYNASHMVPFDFPRRSRDMLDRFMGVDIASIGGTPSDSRIDGEKGVEVSVGGHTNSTAAKEEESLKIQAAKWAAYRRSGEVALVFVIVGALAFGFFVWRDRRRRQGYAGVLGTDPYDRNSSMSGGLGLNGARPNGKRRQTDQDIEAARDFDEAELEDLEPRNGNSKEAQHFGLDDDEDEDEDIAAHGHARNGRM